MPYSIIEEENKYRVVKDDSGETMGEHDTREKAQAQIAAIYANEGKGLNLSYAKSILPAITAEMLAVKMIGTDTIRGYVALWGDADAVDLVGDYFTPETDFWDSHLKGVARPLTIEHGLDEATKAMPVVGNITEMGDDKLGRWYTAQLNTAHQYHTVVKKLIEEGKFGTSSDSVPQYVQREPKGKTSAWLKTWPLFGASLTVTPCEPRMIGTLEVIKSLGINLPDAPAYQAWKAKTKRQIDIMKLYI